MTKQQVLNLFYSFNKLNSITGAKFAYAMEKNRQILETAVKEIEKSLQPSDEYTEFDKKRLELARTMSQKETNGTPMIVNNNFVMADQRAFDKAFEILKAQYQKAVDEREKQMNEYNAHLKDEIDLDIHFIKLSGIPDSVTVEQMRIIEPFIDTI